MAFSFESHQVRAVMADGTPWFVGRDVCNALEIKNVSDTLRTKRIDSKGKEYINFPENEKADIDIIYISSNGTRQARKTLCVNEPGLYRLIFQSRKPEAERFKTLVFNEILPQIRRTGRYVPDAVKDVIKKIPLRDAVPAIEAAMRQDGCSINTIWLVTGIVEMLLSYIATYQTEFELQQKLNRCKRSKRRATPKDIEEIRELHKAGYTKKDISRMTYRGRTVINNALREEVDQPGLFDDEPTESFGGPLIDAARGKGETE
jgi:prophage antirepressor-like protein